jgi:hypothetical protein
METFTSSVVDDSSIRNRLLGLDSTFDCPTPNLYFSFQFIILKFEFEFEFEFELEFEFEFEECCTNEGVFVPYLYRGVGSLERLRGMTGDRAIPYRDVSSEDRIPKGIS